jgi:transmembrane sensor
MDIYKFKKKLKRYLDGESNETESALIEAWYKSYTVDEQKLTESEAASLRDAIHNKVKSAVFKKRVIHSAFFRIAASLVIISTISALIWKYTRIKNDAIVYYTFETGTKGMKEITLPDSSVIWLNAKSRIKVPTTFQGQFRTVQLEEGEAFFNIKRDSYHPFIVQLAELNVQVWGTSFNIRNYKNLKSINISVTTGKVGITKHGRTLAMLLPDQQLCYTSANGKYYQQTVVPGRAQSWKQGYTYLTDADFKELSLVVKNIFGLSLKAANNRINAYHFTLRVEHNIPADQILKVIGQLHNTHYRKEGNEIILY